MNFFLDTAGFLLFLFVALFLPGRLLFSLLKIKLDTLPSLFLPFTTGIVTFTLFAYVFAFLHIGFLLLPLCIVTSIASVVKQKVVLPKIGKKQKLALLAVGIMTFLFAIPSFFTGVFGQNIFYSRDDLWHLMLIHELIASFPPNNPGFVGIPLHGYHFFYDFLIAQAHRYFFTSVESLHFRFFPLLLAYLWGIGVYSFAVTWSKKIAIGLWSVFLTFFGGSFAYGLLLQGHKGFNFDSSLGIAQPASSLTNPPFAISIALLLTGFFALFYFYQTKKTTWLILFVLAVGLTPMFKVYAGILLMASFGLFIIAELLKRNFKMLWTVPFVALLFFGTYWYFASGSGYLIWYPLWGPHSILQSFPWYNYDNKVYFYTHLQVTKGIIQTEVDGLTIFLLGNLGTRLIGLLIACYFVLQQKKRLTLFTSHIVLLSGIAIFLPLFFLQSGKVFEIIQMAWYFLFLVSIIAAWGLGFLLEQKFALTVKVLFVVGFLILTLPSTYDVFRGVGQNSAFNPTTTEGQVIAILAKDPVYTHTVLEIPAKLTAEGVNDWYTNTYPDFAAFGNKNAFVANEYIDFPGVPTNQRLQEMATIGTFSTEQKAALVKKYHIFYVLSLSPQNLFSPILGAKKVFVNDTTSLYAFPQ